MLNAIFVILGAALWATDTIFRHPMVQQISAVSIVYLEHQFALVAAAAWFLIHGRRNFKFTGKGMMGAALIGIFGSALATIAFTLSFQFVNPSVSILLQKTQPIIVILLSAIFLGEKLSGKFFAWAIVALVSAFYLSFPQGIHQSDLDGANLQGVVLALLASFLWAVSTVIGKFTLRFMNSSALTMWRFFFGFSALWLFLKAFPLLHVEIPFIMADTHILRSIFFMALIPGFLGVTLYYRGLTRMNASVATLLELSFPLCAVFINSYFLGFSLSGVQLLSAGVLLLAIGMISSRGIR